MCLAGIQENAITYNQKLNTGISDQSFVLSLQLASTTSCYKQLVSIPYLQL